MMDECDSLVGEYTFKPASEPNQMSEPTIAVPLMTPKSEASDVPVLQLKDAPVEQVSIATPAGEMTPRREPESMRSFELALRTGREPESDTAARVGAAAVPASCHNPLSLKRTTPAPATWLTS